MMSVYKMSQEELTEQIVLRSREIEYLHRALDAQAYKLNTLWEHQVRLSERMDELIVEIQVLAMNLKDAVGGA